MNDTPTPRTDDSETRVRKNGFSSLIEYCYANDMAKLERELTATTEERDRLAEEVRQLKSRLTQTMGAVTISRNGYVQELEQQRDRLAERLRESNLQLQYLDEKYPSGTTPTCIIRNDKVLQSLTPNAEP